MRRMVSTWVHTLSGWLYAVLVVVLVVTTLLRKREPSAALGWSLAIVFLPVLGPFMFLLFGINKMPRRLRRKVAHHLEFSHPEAFRAHEAEHAAGGHPDGRWSAIGRMIESLGEGPRRTGNHVRVYADVRRLADDLRAAIDAARHHIHVEFYIFRFDEAGKRLTERLVEKIEEGVQVRVLMDGFGSWWSRHVITRKIRRAGGEAAAFNVGGRYSPQLRNHRKIVICDGEVGFFGGRNIGTEYLGRHGPSGREWYDLHACVRGPAVWDLQRMFIEDWSFVTEHLLDDHDFFPDMEPAGDAPLQIVGGGPDVEDNAIRHSILGGFAVARRSIHIATPYLVPDMALRDTLKTAAMGGVEVHIVTQAPPPDQWLTYHCGMFYIEELLGAGVRVYGYTPGMMHAKAIAVDGEWAMLGTANLDNRSMFLNFEQMGVFDGEDEAAEIERALRALVSASEEILPETMRNRTRRQKFAARVARLFAPLL
jgi:cardiolipin synthase